MIEKDDFIRYINSWVSTYTFINRCNAEKEFLSDDLHTLLSIFLNQHFNNRQILIIDTFLYKYNYINLGSHKNFQVSTYSLGLTNEDDNYQIKNLNELYNYL